MPPLSVLALGLVALTLGAWLTGSRELLALTASSLTALTAYIGAGFILLRVSPGAALKCIVAMPGFAAWKGAVYLRALMRTPASWEPTRPSMRR
jgi:hypothetical protein